MKSRQKLSFLFLLMLTCSITNVFSQSKYTFTNRLNLRIFGGLSAQNGVSYSNLFSDNKSGPFGSMFLGYRFDEQNKSANYFGVFGNLAQVDANSVLLLKSDDVMSISPNFTGGLSYAYEIEGGFVFGDWFRLSAGKGNMQVPISNSWQSVDYYTGTGGFIFGKKAINLHTSTTVLFGGDMKRTAFRVNLGLGFSFKFLKSRKQDS
jgi:hypothetical protein